MGLASHNSIFQKLNQLSVGNFEYWKVGGFAHDVVIVGNVGLIPTPSGGWNNLVVAINILT